MTTTTYIISNDQNTLDITTSDKEIYDSNLINDNTYYEEDGVKFLKLKTLFYQARDVSSDTLKLFPHLETLREEIIKAYRKDARVVKVSFVVAHKVDVDSIIDVIKQERADDGDFIEDDDIDDEYQAFLRLSLRKRANEQ